MRGVTLILQYTTSQLYNLTDTIVWVHRGFCLFHLSHINNPSSMTVYIILNIDNKIYWQGRIQSGTEKNKIQRQTSPLAPPHPPTHAYKDVDTIKYARYICLLCLLMTSFDDCITSHIHIYIYKHDIMTYYNSEGCALYSLTEWSTRKRKKKTISKNTPRHLTSSC